MKTNTTLEITTPTPPPHWALLQRRLLIAQSTAIEEFYAQYFDERGYLLCVPRWGGDDGPDDAAENLLNWTLLYALGAPDIVLELYKRGWEGHLKQYTEAKSVDVPFAREGMYFREFPVMFDWMHHSEGLSAFFLQGLSDPYDPLYQQRMRRYCGFYMNEDPLAENYDPEHKVIRSMFNGSRGPLMRKATGLDWAGDPIDVERFGLLHEERSYEEMVAHFKDYNDVVGDHPLNLCTTTLALNAYMLSGESKYRDWLVGYVDAWVQRTEDNGGIIPTNIGLDGTIGGACDGKWYGGVYGWGFSVEVPQTGELAHRPSFLWRAPYGFGNALLLTGDQRYVETWRGVIDKVNENAKEIDGQTHYPHMHGDDGWYDYTVRPFDDGALEVYYWSMNPDDRTRVASDPWIKYLNGDDPQYPVKALQEGLESVRAKAESIRTDTSTPDTRLSDIMNASNPATTETLTQLMLGGLPTGRVGFPLHCRLRYFDPIRRRAGIPQDVAALVKEMNGNTVTVSLVNLDATTNRTVIVQGGAYAEHQFHTVSAGGESVAIEDASFKVRLAPGCGTRLKIKMKRYANTPTLAFPWDR
jgi:hypothetical protein